MALASLLRGPAGLLFASLLALGCGGGGGSSAGGGGPQPTYALTLSNGAPTVTQGQAGTVNVTVTPANGFSGAVGLALTGLPAGATSSFAPASATSTSTLNLQVGAGVNPGSYPLTVTGTASGVSAQTATLILTVALGGSAGGTLTTDVFVVDTGQTVTVTDSLTVNASKSISILGSLLASGKAGQSITLVAQNDVTISGSVAAGDGAGDQDGGSLTVTSTAGKITISGPLKAGSGASGVGTSNGNGSTLASTARGGAGSHGGSVLLRAKAGSISFGPAAGLVQVGNGGKGLDLSVQGADLATFQVPAQLANAGGNSGALLVDSPTLTGVTTRSVTVPNDFPPQNPVFLKGSSALVVTSANVAGGLGGPGGSFVFGTRAATLAPSAAGEIRPALAPGGSSGQVVRGSNGGSGMFSGGDGGDATANGLPATGDGTDGQSVDATGGSGGWGSLSNGNGGSATANASSGTKGADPNSSGGKGGSATAHGGPGKKGGNATAVSGNGGDGGNACPSGGAFGGPGGNPGAANSYGGASSGIGNPDGNASSTGGNGGNGGNGKKGGGGGGASGVAWAQSTGGGVAMNQGNAGNWGTVCPTPAVSGGVYHSLFKSSGGALYAVGGNQWGQCGANFPDQVVNTGVKAVPGFPVPPGTAKAGAFHNAADGQVYTWGSDYYGQLGDGTFNDSPAPRTLAGLANAVDVAPGFAHTVAVLSDGTVRAWGGYTALPLLGNGTTNTSASPVQVTGLTNVQAVAAGNYGFHSLALKSDGTVWAWGSNDSGQLGDGSTQSRSTPVPVAGLSGVVAISAGMMHSLALKGDGTVWIWGIFLGHAYTAPTQVTGLAGITDIAAGGVHNLARKSDGTVWVWGSNGSGQLGTGNTTDVAVPVQLTALSGITQIGAGAFHSLARKSDGTVWTWGNNASGQLGDGSSTERHAPVPVAGLTLN